MHSVAVTDGAAISCAEGIVDTPTSVSARETFIDDSSLAQAYEALAPALRRYVAVRLRDNAAAEDIVQEAFARLAGEIQASRRPTDPRAWLYRVVLNLIISGARHAEVVRRVNRHPFDDVDLHSPEAVALSLERDRALGAALEAASADGRAGIILAAQGYSGREIAHVIGRYEGATRTLMSRTRVSMRRRLASFADVA